MQRRTTTARQPFIKNAETQKSSNSSCDSRPADPGRSSSSRGAESIDCTLAAPVQLLGSISPTPSSRGLRRQLQRSLAPPAVRDDGYSYRARGRDASPSAGEPAESTLKIRCEHPFHVEPSIALGSPPELRRSLWTVAARTDEPAPHHCAQDVARGAIRLPLDHARGNTVSRETERHALESQNWRRQCLTLVAAPHVAHTPDTQHTYGPTGVEHMGVADAAANCGLLRRSGVPRRALCVPALSRPP